MIAARTALERLVQERGESLADLSRMLRRNPAYLQQYVRRGTPRRLDEEDRRLLARHFGVDEAVLRGGSLSNGKPEQSAEDAAKAPTHHRIGWLKLAGGALPQAHGNRAFFLDTGWLERMGLLSSALSLARIEEESMMPTLHMGDEILIGHDACAEPLREGIYVVGDEAAPHVRRIVPGPRRTELNILTDNPLFPDWLGVERAKVSVIGRVLWSGRRMP